MNSAEYVAKKLEEMKTSGMALMVIAWNIALLCVGWAYVFGARWQYCTPANRRARYSDEHPTIKTACKNYNGSGSSGCVGCKWYPNSKYTRINDCRGFTYGILKAVYGWELMGESDAQSELGMVGLLIDKLEIDNTDPNQTTLIVTRVDRY